MFVLEGFDAWWKLGKEKGRDCYQEFVKKENKKKRRKWGGGGGIGRMDRRKKRGKKETLLTSFTRAACIVVDPVLWGPIWIKARGLLASQGQNNTTTTNTNKRR